MPTEAKHTWIVDQVSVFFLAGHETTASTLTWASIIMAKAPHWRTAWLENEPGFRVAFIKEVMRLYPAGVFLPRVSAHHTLLRTHRVSRGAMLLISPWVLHRHPHYWDQPEEFRPERFFKDVPRPTQGSYLPFGLGARACIGGAFSFTEADIILSAFAEQFEWQLNDEADIKPWAGLTLSVEGRAIVSLSRRRRTVKSINRAAAMS